MRVVDPVKIINARAVHAAVGWALLGARHLVNTILVDFSLLILIQEVFEIEIFTRVKLAAAELHLIQLLLGQQELLLVVLAEMLFLDLAQVFAKHARFLPLEADVGGHWCVRVRKLLEETWVLVLKAHALQQR